MNFSHYLITQFNLRNFSNLDKFNDESWLAWTRNRIELFRKYCLPSVINQTGTNFTWLLFFDSDTPDEFSEFLKHLKLFRFIDICYSRGIDDFNATYINEVKKRTNKTDKWIITTRIDNDDCLHRDAIKTIQENFRERNKYLISLASGYTHNTADRTLSHYFYPMSPFISLIESNEDCIEGVYSKSHTKWDELRLFIIKELWLEWFNKKARKARFILKNPYWIQIVHGGNVSNSFFRGFPVLKEKNLRDFSLSYSSRKMSILTICKYYDYVTWKRYLKSLIIMMVLNK